MFFYDEAFKASGIVMSGFKSGELIGRAADGGPSLPWLANMAIAGGSGDHVEIGSLYGASAMVVATAKAMAGLSGTVYCIDPWRDRKETSVRALTRDAEENLSAHMDDVKDNIKKLTEILGKVDIKPLPIELIRAKSQPWPHQLDKLRFVTSYIDGLHYGDTPKLDILECAKRTSHYIGLDNYEETYPDIMGAVHEVIARKDGKEPEWCLYFKNMLFVALRRWQPPRNTRMSTDLGHL